jgi:hypothetical protein
MVNEISRYYEAKELEYVQDEGAGYAVSMKTGEIKKESGYALDATYVLC